MKRRVLSYILTVLCSTVFLLTMICVFSTQAAASEDSLIFIEDADGVGYFVDGYNGAISGKLEIPATYNGKPVIWIDNYAFYECTALTEVVIPGSVTKIKGNAFAMCTALKKVTFEEGVEVIEESAFRDCTAITSITFPASIKELGDLAFARCSALTKLHFKGDVPYVKNFTFKDVRGVAYYPPGNFSWESVGLAYHGGSLRAEPDTTMDSVPQGGEWNYFNGVLAIKGNGPMEEFDGDHLPPWADLAEQVYTLNVEEGVTSISPKAFAQFTQLSQVNLPSTLEAIGSQAFAGCERLKILTVPMGVQSLGDNCFAGCTFLQTAFIAASVTSMGQDVFAQCIALREIYFDGDVPQGVNFGPGPVTVFYPGTNPTWTEELRGSFGDGITWDVPYCQLGHTVVVDEAVDGGCLEGSLTEGSHCSVCGEIIIPQYITYAPGHSFGEWYVTKEPTETEEGSEECVCSVCGFVEEQKIEKISVPASSTGAATAPSATPTTAPATKPVVPITQPTGSGAPAEPEQYTVLWVLISLAAAAVLGGTGFSLFRKLVRK